MLQDKTFAFNLVETVDLLTTYENGKRFYLTPTGNHYPSVTSVVGFEKNNFFARWRRENPIESARVTRRGTELHSLIERYMRGEGVSVTCKDTNDLVDENLTATVLELFEKLRTHINDNIDNIIGQETPLWSDLLKMAGRVDLVADYKGKLSIIDFKGSTKVKRESDIENYFLQTTAYAIMWHERTKIPVKQIVLLISSEDGDVQEFVEDPMNWVPKLRQAISKYRTAYP